MRSTYVRTYGMRRPTTPRTVPWHAHARTQHAIRNPQCSNAAEINSNAGSMHNIVNPGTQMDNQAANIRSDGGITPSHDSISGNEAGLSSGSGNEARSGNGTRTQPNTQELQTVSQILVTEPSVRVHLPPIWSFYSTKSVLQAPKPSCGLFEITWDPLCHLFRQSPNHAPGQRDGDQAHSYSCGFTGGFVFSSQLSQVTVEPSQIIDFLGFIVDSLKRELRLPQAKLTQIRQEAHSLLRREYASARNLAQLLGKMSAAVLAVHPAPFITGNFKTSNTEP